MISIDQMWTWRLRRWSQWKAACTLLYPSWCCDHLGCEHEANHVDGFVDILAWLEQLVHMVTLRFLWKSNADVMAFFKSLLVITPRRSHISCRFLLSRMACHRIGNNREYVNLWFDFVCFYFVGVRVILDVVDVAVSQSWPELMLISLTLRFPFFFLPSLDATWTRLNLPIYHRTNKRSGWVRVWNNYVLDHSNFPNTMSPGITVKSNG